MRITTSWFIDLRTVLFSAFLPLLVVYTAACGKDQSQKTDNNDGTEIGSGDTSEDPNHPTTGPTTRLVGRFMTSADANQTGKEFAWSATEMITRVMGTGVTISLSDSNNLETEISDGNTTSTITSHNIYSVYVDGVLNTTLTLDPNQSSYTIGGNLSYADHTIRVLKKTEANIGTTVFGGFEPLSGEKLLPAPWASGRRIEFIGDEFLVGYSQDANAGTTCNPNLQNAGATFASLTAGALGADYVAIAYSNKGVFQNRSCVSDQMTMPNLYPSVLPNQDDESWDFTSWTPQVVVVNLGNSDYTPTEDGCTIPSNDSDVSQSWLLFLANIRDNYPDAHIFAMVGPSLHNDPNSQNVEDPNSDQLLRTRAQQVIRNAVTKFEDSNTFFFDCPEDLGSNGYACDTQPSLATHQIVSEELVSAIRQYLPW